MIKRVLDTLFTAVSLLLVIPTTLILVSWNAIPGDRLYSLKSGLEDAVILVFSGTPLLPKVSMKFTDRRLTEATELLSKKGSTVGYGLLIAEAKQTQSYITEKSDIQSGVQFSKNIDGYKKEIEKKKAEVKAEIARGDASTVSVPIVTVASAPTPVATSPNTPTEQPTSQVVIVNKPETVVIQEESPVTVLQKLEDTESELVVIQLEVEKENNNNSGKTNQEYQRSPSF